MDKKVALINTKAPFSTADAKESLDLALIYGSYEQAVSLFFVGDGVYQLSQNIQASKLETKDFLKTFAAFEFYDIEHVYVCKQSLLERSMPECFHIDDVQVIEHEAMQQLIHQHHVILTF